MDNLVTLTERELAELMLEATKSYNMTEEERSGMSMAEGLKLMIKRIISEFKNSKK